MFGLNTISPVMTEVDGDTLDLSAESKNREHHKSLEFVFNYQYLGASWPHHCFYWRDYGAKVLFSAVRKQLGGDAQDWVVMAGGQSFTFDNTGAQSIADFFGGRVTAGLTVNVLKASKKGRALDSSVVELVGLAEVPGRLKTEAVSRDYDIERAEAAAAKALEASKAAASQSALAAERVRQLVAERDTRTREMEMEKDAASTKAAELVADIGVLLAMKSVERVRLGREPTDDEVAELQERIARLAPMPCEQPCGRALRELREEMRELREELDVGWWAQRGLVSYKVHAAMMRRELGEAAAESDSALYRETAAAARRAAAEESAVKEAAMAAALAERAAMAERAAADREAKEVRDVERVLDTGLRASMMRAERERLGREPTDHEASLVRAYCERVVTSAQKDPAEASAWWEKRGMNLDKVIDGVLSRMDWPAAELRAEKLKAKPEVYDSRLGRSVQPGRVALAELSAREVMMAAREPAECRAETGQKDLRHILDKLNHESRAPERAERAGRDKPRSGVVEKRRREAATVGTTQRSRTR